MGHKQKSRNHEPTRARHEQTLIFRVLCFVFFRVTRVVNDFLCPNVVSFDLVYELDEEMSDTSATALPQSKTGHSSE